MKKQTELWKKIVKNTIQIVLSVIIETAEKFV